MVENQFNYTKIPDGYYDDIFHNDKGMRGFWHWSKFDTVKKIVLSKNKNKNLNRTSRKILDIGCFSGTFLGMLNERDFSFQLGIDILDSQIDFANKKYQTNCRRFLKVENMENLLISEHAEYNKYFDVITVIEVIEHLNAQEISHLLNNTHRLLKDDGELIITTPNYFSIWPLLEFYLNKFSDISYKEQHITKFSYFNFERKISSIVNNFHSLYFVELKTTSHLLTPFLAKFNYDFAKKIASVVNAKHWKVFLGPLLVIKFKKLNWSGPR